MPPLGPDCSKDAQCTVGKKCELPQYKSFITEISEYAEYQFLYRSTPEFIARKVNPVASSLGGDQFEILHAVGVFRRMPEKKQLEETHPRDRRRRLSRLAPVPTVCSSRATRSSASTTSSPAPRTTSSICWRSALRADAPRRDLSRSTWRSTRSTTSPVPPRRSTTSTTRCRPPRPACTARSTCWGSPSALKCKIFQASTSEVYGDPSVHPQPEDYWGNVNPIGPRSCYDEGKRCAETLFFDYWRQHGLRIKVARIFNTYGPRMHPQRRPRGVELHRPGPEGRADHGLRRRQQTRSFCYVDDLIDGFLRLMDSDDRSPAR
jgi:hypothetical protein